MMNYSKTGIDFGPAFQSAFNHPACRLKGALCEHVHRILLFHKGELVAEGKHAELLQENEIYRHLNYLKFHPSPITGE